jgi:hypothetical protein
MSFLSRTECSLLGCRTIILVYLSIKIDSVRNIYAEAINISYDQIEIIHEQLPLPVPCYDLLPVIELTLGHDKRRFRVFPTPLS